MTEPIASDYADIARRAREIRRAESGRDDNAYTAIGADLDALGAFYGAVRADGETDWTFRTRVLAAIAEGPNPPQGVL